MSAQRWFISGISAAVTLVLTMGLGSLGQSSKDLPTSQPSADGQSFIAPDTELQTVTQAIVGVWDSAEDPLDTVEFGGDGSFLELCESRSGPIQTSGKWSAFSNDMRPELHLPADGVYIAEVIGPATYLYQVQEATDQSFALMFLPKGNMLSFTRVR